MRKATLLALAGVVATSGLAHASGKLNTNAKLATKGTIAEGSGAPGLKLGMKQAAVKKRLGKPYRPCHTHKGVHYCHWVKTTGPNKTVSLSTTFRGGRLVWLQLTDGDRWKTAKKVKLKDKLAVVKRAYGRKLRLYNTCLLDRGYVAEVARGRAITSFWFHTKESAEAGYGYVSAITIYDVKKIDWEGNLPPRRPRNVPGCARPNSPEGPNTGPKQSPAPAPEPSPAPAPEPDPEPEKEEPAPEGEG